MRKTNERTLNKNLYLLINPNGQAGAAGALIQAKLPQLLQISPSLKIEITETIEDLQNFIKAFIKRVRSAPNKGKYFLIMAGGDGSLGELLDQIFKIVKIWPENLILGALPIGTGNDYLRNYFQPASSIVQAYRHFIEAPTRSLDLMKVTYVQKNGQVGKRIGLNVLSAGLEGLVDQMVAEQKKSFSAKWTYFSALIGAVLKYQAFPVEIKVDQKKQNISPFFCLAVSKGCYFGAGMKIMPEARTNDGYLHWIVIPNVAIWSYVNLIWALYAGTILTQPGVQSGKAKNIEIKARPDQIYSQSWSFGLDGNSHGSLPLKIEVMPRAFRMKI